MRSSRWWKSPAVLLLSWLFSELCLASATLQDSPLAILCLTRHTVHAPARGQQHSSMGMQQGQPWRLPLAIPAVITWQPRANFPIDRVWRVGEKNSLPHGSSNSSEPSFQRLYHEQNGKQDRSLLLPQEFSFLKLLSAVVRPCWLPNNLWVRVWSLLHNPRHIQVNVPQHWAAQCGFPHYRHFLPQKVTREPSAEGAKATPALKGSRSYALVMFSMAEWEFTAIKAFSTSCQDRTPTLLITGCACVPQQKMESIKKYWCCSGRPLGTSNNTQFGLHTAIWNCDSSQVRNASLLPSFFLYLPFSRGF